MESLKRCWQTLDWLASGTTINAHPHHNPRSWKHEIPSKIAMQTFFTGGGFCLAFYVRAQSIALTFKWNYVDISRALDVFLAVRYSRQTSIGCRPEVVSMSYSIWLTDCVDGACNQHYGYCRRYESYDSITFSSCVCLYGLFCCAPLPDIILNG